MKTFDGIKSLLDWNLVRIPFNELSSDKSLKNSEEIISAAETIGLKSLTKKEASTMAERYSKQPNGETIFIPFKKTKGEYTFGILAIGNDNGGQWDGERGNHEIESIKHRGDFIFKK